jgi:hypothetical protein
MGLSRISASCRFWSVMQSHSRHSHASKAACLAALLWWGLAFVCPAQAGQYQLLAEQANTVVVAARVQNAEQVCNLAITVQGQPVVAREVRAPYFETFIDITPQDAEFVTVTWQGQFKRVNGVAVNACPVQGRAQYRVVDDNAPLRTAWGSWLSSMGPAKADCVRTALQSDRVRYEWFDLNDPQVSPEDWKIQRALTQCDAFVAQKKAWGDKNPQRFACVLSGGLKTQCEGYYTATDNGKTQPISGEMAVRRQLDNLPWGSGVRETAAAKAARQRAEQALKARLAAEEEAKIKAEEQARLREAQQAQEALAAQARERKEKAEAERARRLQELDRLEQERLEKRSWLLKQLEKLKSDPKADAKSGDKTDAKADAKGDVKSDNKADAKGQDAKPEEAQPKATSPQAAQPQAPQPENPQAK